MEGIFILVIVLFGLLVLGDFKFEFLPNGRGFEVKYISKLKFPNNSEDKE